MQYVRVEVEEGRAYTYTWDGDEPLSKDEVVVLPGNIVKDREFEGRVIREISAEDVARDSYKGEYKAVLRRAGHLDGCPLRRPELRDPDEGPLECLCADLQADLDLL